VTNAGPIPVVYDVNVLVGAAIGGNSPYRSWPSPPPVSGNAYADCVGVVNDAAEFALWLSPHLLETTAYLLQGTFKWETDQAEALLTVFVELAEDSGGGAVDPPRAVFDCSDQEDNLVLDLAAHVGALLLVSEDADLTSMSPWRGTPILRPRDFVTKVDGMRRGYRRR
jgi:predicted nucleic acid-binding protein